MDYMVKHYQNLAKDLLNKKLQLIEELKVLSEKNIPNRDSRQAIRQMFGLPGPGQREQSWADWQPGDEDSPDYDPYFPYDNDGNYYDIYYDKGDPLGSFDSEGRPLRYEPRADKLPKQLDSSKTSSASAAASAQPPAPPPMLAADGNNQPEVLPPNLPPQNEIPPLIAVGEPGSPGVVPLPPTQTPPPYAPMIPGVPIPASPSNTAPTPAATAPAAPPVTPAAPPTARATPTTPDAAGPSSGYAPRSAYNFKQDARYMAGAKDMFQDERKYKAMRGIGMSDYAISKRNEQRAAMDQLRDIEAKKAAGLPVSQRDIQDDAFLRAKYGVGSRNLSAPVKQAYTGLSRPPEGSWEKFDQANKASQQSKSAPAATGTQKPAANTTSAAVSAAAQGTASAKPGSRAESLARAINPVQGALSRVSQNVLGAPPAPLVPGPQRPEANAAARAASAAAQGIASAKPGSRAESLAGAINPVQGALSRVSQNVLGSPAQVNTAMPSARERMGMGVEGAPQETEALTPAQIAARNTLGMGTTPPPAKPKKTAAQKTMGL